MKSELSERKAKVVILAHQGDPLDYQNFTSLKEHRDYLEKFLNKKVKFVEDVTGPFAQEEIKKLRDGDVLLLKNIRLYTEETIIFEEEFTALLKVKLLLKDPTFICWEGQRYWVPFV